MKKTLTVNLGGTVFNIDEDAYRLLDNYLCNLKHHFKKMEGADEIVDDIERRISELFVEKMTSGLQVITVPDVEEVIARVGNPEEMEGEDESSEEAGNARTSATDEGKGSAAQHERKVFRRFYRNPDDKMIGGVASGLAAYFGWDVTVLRLVLLVLMVFGFKLMLPTYIVCWIVVPEAKTAAEKLSMRGEAITVENIGKTVTDGFDRVSNGVNDYVHSGKPQSLLAQIGNGIVQIVGWILKIGLVLFAIICSPFLFAFAIAFLALLFGGIAVLIDGGAFVLSLFPTAHLTLPSAPLTAFVMYIAFTLLIGIPLLSVVYAIFRPLFKWQPMAGGLKLTFWVLWFVSAVTFFICFFMYGGDFPDLFISVH